MEEQITTTTPHLAMALQDFELGDTKIQTGQRLHGIWLLDGFFYFPLTSADEEIFIFSVSRGFVGNIIEG